MKIFLEQNVWDAGLERIERIFNEFPEVIVSFSGGKDSTVTLELALIVAEKLGRLPLKVLFLDQEAEWGSVIDYVRKVMNDPRVEPMWFQIPIKLFNATSPTDPWLYCWAEGEKWMRPHEPNAITENHYGTDRFIEMFARILSTDFAGQKVCYLAGVRAEESPNRHSGLTSKATYQDITWGKVLSKKYGHYNFYPLYDWSYTDIWKSIHDNDWSYCKVYDYFYQYGISPAKMRVSNLHHETAVHQLFYLQEIEGDTWNALTERLGGINSARHMDQKDMFSVRELPYMFESWAEYRDYLLEKLVPDAGHNEIMRKKFKSMDAEYAEMVDITKLHRQHITTILANDFSLTKLSSFISNPNAIEFRKWKKGKPYNANLTNWVPV